MQHAMYKNRLGLFSMIAEMKAYKNNINKVNAGHQTLLHLASTKKNIEFIQVLIQQPKCDLNIQDIRGDTALHIAACSEFKSSEKVSCMLECGRCNPNISNKQGYTPLHKATVNGRYDSVEILLRSTKCNPNIQDLQGNTALHMSIHCISAIDICDTVYVNPQNQEQNDSLHERVLAKSLHHILEKLIRHPHCNPSITNHDGMTPLQLAFKKEQLSAVEILLRVAKCSPEDIAKAVQGSPYLLHHAIYGKKLRPFLMLIELKEYNVNEVDSDHYSLLHVACTKKDLEYLQVLIQQPTCDLNIQDNNADTALHIATRCKCNSAKKIQCILKCDRCDPNITNKQGHTPLHTATVHNQLSCVEIFLNSTKCNPNIQDLQGNTALHLCMGQKSAPDIECFMMCDNVDVNIQNGNGETPLYM